MSSFANSLHLPLDCHEHHGLVRDFPTQRPPITVLCGSTRFYDEFQQANYDLTMEGHIVLSVGFYPHSKVEHGHGEGVGHDSMEKAALDELHKRKIDLADWVYVLNVGGYIGESTRSEIEYAERIGRPVRYLEPSGGCSITTAPPSERPSTQEATAPAALPVEVQRLIRAVEQVRDHWPTTDHIARVDLWAAVRYETDLVWASLGAGGLPSEAAPEAGEAGEPLDGRLTDADDYGRDYEAQAAAMGVPLVEDAVTTGPASPCSCVPVLAHGSRCEHQPVQVEQLVEALDDYQSEVRDDVTWAGIAGVALETLAVAGQPPAGPRTLMATWHPDELPGGVPSGGDGQ